MMPEIEHHDARARSRFVFDELRSKLRERLMLPMKKLHALLHAYELTIEGLVITTRIADKRERRRGAGDHRNQHDREYYVAAR